MVYSIFDKESIDSDEKVRKIKSIVIDWNREKNDFDYSIYYFNDNDKNKGLRKVNVRYSRLGGMAKVG